jgi:rod shape-determining protein MreC
MRDIDRRPWSFGDIGIRLLILGLASILLMALQVTGRLEPVQSAITQLTSPAQVGATGATESVTDALDFVFELRNMRQRNAELEQVNSNLLVENFELREVQRENELMREMLAFAQTRPGLDLRGAQIVAQVIGQESNNFLGYIMLDLGQSHGIEVGYPVVTDQGLVGRISEVNDNTSKVLLISDPSSAVNAIMQSSRLNGVVRGAPGGDLLMDYIQQGQTFKEGEIVLTSGLGGRFPKGIPIGQVIEIRQRDIDVFQQAVIRPTVDLSRLELVMVVTNFDPLEDVPELLVPESVPAQGGEVNPLDAEAPLDSNAPDGEAPEGETVEGEATNESGIDESPTDGLLPDAAGTGDVAPSGETEGGQ